MVYATFLQEFPSSPNTPNGLFGSAVAMIASYMAISAPGLKTVYTYRWSSGVWGASGLLNGNPSVVGALFGSSLAFSGNGLRLAVGSPANNTIYMYFRPTASSTWTLEASITANDIPANSLARFGLSLAMFSNSGFTEDVLVVGAPGIGGESAYIFTRTGTTWTQQQKLISDSPGVIQSFGQSVACDFSNTVVVGAPDATGSAGAQQGKVYFYSRTPGTNSWVLKKVVTASDPHPGDNYGRSVSLSGNTALIGAPGADAPTADTGKAYIVYNLGGNWTEMHQFTSANMLTGSNAGKAVSVFTGYAVIGAPNLGAGANPNAGAAFFARQTGGITSWDGPGSILAPVPNANDNFGSSVAVSGPSIESRALFLAGSPNADGQGTNSGTAYLFAINP